MPFLVSNWWYSFILAIPLAFAMAVISGYPTGVALWILAISILVTLIIAILVSIVRATTGFEISISLVPKMLVGALFPGNTLSVNLFSVFRYVLLCDQMGRP